MFKYRQKGKAAYYLSGNIMQRVNMMEILRKLGVDEETICEMIEMCPEIEELTDDDILQKINILMILIPTNSLRKWEQRLCMIYWCV